MYADCNAGQHAGRQADGGAADDADAHAGHGEAQRAVRGRQPRPAPARPHSGRWALP